MTNGLTWTDLHSAILREWAGKKSDAKIRDEIARQTGSDFAAETITRRRRLMGFSPTGAWAAKPKRSEAEERAKLAQRVKDLSMPEPNSGCFLWLGSANSLGYGLISTSIGVKTAYRVAYEIENGPAAPGMSICHKCDNPGCVNPAHLFAAPHAENMRDMFRKRRNKNPKGERHGRAKLSDCDARYIKASAEHFESLADRFGVALSTIKNIKSGKRWAHLP